MHLPDGRHPRELGDLRPPEAGAVALCGVRGDDGATLYVSDFATGEVVAATAHGGGRRILARVPGGGAPDGLAVDAEGGIWVAPGPAAQVARFAPDGTLDRLLDVPADFVSSVAFDGEALLVATAGALLRTPVGVVGRPVPPARPGR